MNNFNLKLSISHGDIVFLKSKKLYISRSKKNFSKHHSDRHRGNAIKNFTTVNTEAFREYNVINKLENPGTENVFTVGTLQLEVFEQPSLDSDIANRVPFQIHRTEGPGVLCFGNTFRLISMEPGLWMNRRELIPLNREGSLSYADTWNDVVYGISTFSSLWWIPNNISNSNSIVELSNQILSDCPYFIFQFTKPSALEILKDSVCTRTVFADEPKDSWTFEVIALNQ